jgi:hypothetical protein
MVGRIGCNVLTCHSLTNLYYWETNSWTILVISLKSRNICIYHTLELSICRHYSSIPSLYSTEALTTISSQNPRGMEQGKYSLGLLLFFILSCLFLLSFSGSVEAYKNYTVGDSLGWFDKLEKPNVNYQKWVAAKNFSLGDFLSKIPKPSLCKSYMLNSASTSSLFDSLAFYA